MKNKKWFYAIFAGILIMVISIALFISTGVTTLPKTGQIACYNANGDITSCSNTNGQDGNYQAGIAWPNPRFTNNGNGTITDNLTGLMWQQKGSESTFWSNAITYCENLTLSGYTDWRLPNINELESLIHQGKSNTARWLKTQGFTNIWNYSSYWSSSTYAYGTGCAWYVNLDEGWVDVATKGHYSYVLAVRSGQ